MFTRREILASGLAFSCAGCLSVDPDDLLASEDFCEYQARGEPFDPAVDLPPNFTRFQRAFAHRTVRQEQATAFYGPQPLERVSYVEFDDSYYRIEMADTYPVELSALVLSVDWDSGNDPPEDGDIVPFNDLPTTDQLALRSAVYGGLYRKQVHPETTLVHSESPVPYPNGTSESRLTKWDESWVRWHGRLYKLVVHRESTMDKVVHEYEAEQVAEGAASFRAMIADRYIVRLEGLTPGERDILDVAISGGY